MNPARQTVGDREWLGGGGAGEAQSDVPLAVGQVLHVDAADAADAQCGQAYPTLRYSIFAGERSHADFEDGLEAEGLDFLADEASP